MMLLSSFARDAQKCPLVSRVVHWYTGAMKPIPYSKVRRQDRTVADETWIREMLDKAPIGVLAMAVDGVPYLNTNLFVFDGDKNVLYLHTAAEGRTRASIAANPRVCFSVSEMGRLLPADTAKGMSVEYAGVIAEGRAAVVEDRQEAEHALVLLLGKYLPHLTYANDYAPVTPEELAETAVYRVEIESWNGKRKQATADFPGAFKYGERQTKAGG